MTSVVKLGWFDNLGKVVFMELNELIVHEWYVCLVLVIDRKQMLSSLLYSILASSKLLI